MKKVHTGRITSLEKNQIFVFGSNLQGIHGAGAAKQALQWGAVKGQGKGIQGQTYALPTKITPWNSLPWQLVERNVDEFLGFAADHAEVEFLVTDIGCGLAGFTYEQIAPMFLNAPENVILSQKMQEHVDNLQTQRKFRGYCSCHVRNKGSLRKAWSKSTAILEIEHAGFLLSWRWPASDTE